MTAVTMYQYRFTVMPMISGGMPKVRKRIDAAKNGAVGTVNDQK